MQNIIPDKLPSKATQGEKKLHAVLSQLPDDCLVYYEPNIGNRQPDFIVISPRHGVLTIEVKDWYRGTVISGSLKTVRIKGKNMEHEKEVEHPLEQARDYKFRLMNNLQNNLFSYLILHSDGPYKGNFKFPIGHCVFLSNITKKQLSGDDFSVIFPECTTFYRDHIDEWLNVDAYDLENALAKYFCDPFTLKTPLNSDEVDAIRASVYPEVGINTEKSQPGDSIKVLDRRQEANARQIGSGHRIIYGVAGSGKTIILVSRAKYLAKKYPENKFLMVCFNITLSIYLKSMFEEYENIDVYHFDGLASAMGLSRNKDEANGLFGQRLLDENVKFPENFVYDAVLVDEAQDFSPEWFQVLLKTMCDPEEGDFVIVADGSQSLYSNSKISWASLGIKARGRTIKSKFDLEYNYRNTKAILRLASLFAVKEENRLDDHDILSIPVTPENARGEEGVDPFINEYENRDKEIDGVLRFIHTCIEEKGCEPHEIAILHPSGYPYPQLQILLDRIEADLSQPALWVTRKRENRYRIMDEGVKIQTIYSAKGLQYKAVGIVGVDLFENSVDHERLMYVGTTRSEKYLHVSYLINSQNRIIEKLSAYQ